MLDQQALDYIAGQEQEALALLKEIAQIPAPSGKEELRAKFCKDWADRPWQPRGYLSTRR